MRFAMRARATVFCRLFRFYEISLFFLFAFALISASERKMPFSEKENAKQTSRQQQKDIARFRAQSKLELLALQWQRRRHYHCRRQRNTISWVKHFFLRQYFFSLSFHVHWRLCLCVRLCTVCFICHIFQIIILIVAIAFPFQPYRFDFSPITLNDPTNEWTNKRAKKMTFLFFFQSHTFAVCRCYLRRRSAIVSNQVHLAVYIVYPLFFPSSGSTLTFYHFERAIRDSGSH